MGNNVRTIDEIFEEGALIDEALKRGVQEALLRHKQLDKPVVTWQEGKIVWVMPEDIPAEVLK